MKKITFTAPNGGKYLAEISKRGPKTYLHKAYKLCGGIWREIGNIDVLDSLQTYLQK